MKDKQVKIVIKKIMIITGCILVMIFGGLYWYVSDYYHADMSVSILDEQSMVYDEEIEGYVFKPQEEIKKGIIFYPGAKVDELAYATLMQKLTQEGYLCIITKMPFHFAVLKINAADKIISKYDQVTDWYMMGHSLGGAMAAQYVSEHMNSLKGLILLGAYSTNDLSDSPLQVISIYGSEDRVLNKQKYQNNYSLLPKETKELVIEGGNHAQFGNYGVQSGDGEASLSANEQQNQTVQFIIESLKLQNESLKSMN